MRTIDSKDFHSNVLDAASSTTNYRRNELRRVIEEAAAIAETPIALISLVDQRHERFVAALGIEPRPTLGLKAMCSQTVLQPGEPMVILNARRDGAYQQSPVVAGPMLIGFYVGIPLIDRAGYALGALCALDKTPREKSPEPSTLERLAQLARKAERLIAG